MFHPHPPNSPAGQPSFASDIPIAGVSSVTVSDDIHTKDDVSGSQGHLPRPRFHPGHLVQHSADADPSRKVRVAVIQAATVMYDTNATLAKGTNSSLYLSMSVAVLHNDCFLSGTKPFNSNSSL